MHFIKPKEWAGFVSLLFIWLLPCFSYSPQLFFDYQGGSRHILRGSMLVPMWQQTDKLLFGNVTGAYTFAPSREFNIGFGYRQQIHRRVPIILGGYGFYDRRYTRRDNIFNQFTFGLEALGTGFEGRINFYLPFAKKEYRAFAGKTFSNIGKNIYLADNYTIAKALAGLDTEIGTQVFNLPINVFAKWYYFSCKEAPRISGASFRVNYHPFNWLTVSGEYSYDKVRRHNYLASLGVRFSFDNNKISPLSLEGKMTQMPVRDIDIMETEYQQADNHQQAAIVETAAQFLDALHQGEKNILVNADLDFDNRQIPYFTTRDGYLDSLTILGVRITVDRKGIQEAKLQTRRLTNYILPGHITASYLNGARALFSGFFPKISNSKLAYLSLQNWRSQMDVPVDSDIISAGLVGIAVNSEIHHVTNASFPVGQAENELFAGIIGLVSNNTKVAACTNTAIMRHESMSGIALFATDNSRVSHNVNAGDLLGDYNAGIVYQTNNNALVTHNINIGTINANHSAGIVYDSQDRASINSNFNIGDINSTSGGIAFWVGDNSEVHRNLNVGKVMQDGGGIVYTGTGSAKIYRNLNVGNIEGENGAGIMYAAEGEAIVERNMSFGVVQAERSSGIVRQAKSNAKVISNVNQGRILGSESSGVVNQAGDSSVIFANINKGMIFSNKSGGISQCVRDNALLLGNSNRGNVQKTSMSAGIVTQAQDSARVLFNNNYGDITGSDSAGIAVVMRGNSVLGGNFNYGRISSIRGAGIVRESTGRSRLFYNVNKGCLLGSLSAGIIHTQNAGSVAVYNINLPRVEAAKVEYISASAA